MIDWFSVAANSLWIVGLAVLLATFSYSDWKKSVEKSSLRAVLGEFTPSLCINFGLFLFCSGLLATSTTWWERAGWGIALLLVVGQVVADVIEHRKISPNVEDQ